MQKITRRDFLKFSGAAVAAAALTACSGGGGGSSGGPVSLSTGNVEIELKNAHLVEGSDDNEDNVRVVEAYFEVSNKSRQDIVINESKVACYLNGKLSEVKYIQGQDLDADDVPDTDDVPLNPLTIGAGKTFGVLVYTDASDVTVIQSLRYLLTLGSATVQITAVS